jgi:hypothetical protein
MSRCEVCYHGHAELYVCERCACGAQDWNQRFGDDDAISTSPSAVSAGIQNRLRQEIEPEHHEMLQGIPENPTNTAWADRMRKLRSQYVYIHRTPEDRKALTQIPIDPFDWFNVHQQQAGKARSPVYVKQWWQRFTTMWAHLGLRIWADQLIPPNPNQVEVVVVAPKKKRLRVRIPKIGEELLTKIEQDELVMLQQTLSGGKENDQMP